MLQVKSGIDFTKILIRPLISIGGRIKIPGKSTPSQLGGRFPRFDFYTLVFKKTYKKNTVYYGPQVSIRQWD